MFINDKQSTGRISRVVEIIPLSLEWTCIKSLFEPISSIHLRIKALLSDYYMTLLKLLNVKFADLDKERPLSFPLVRPLPIPYLHDWRKMEVCLINYNKGEDDDGCFRFCNIL